MVRYQVFISSTYRDLIKERSVVKKALLEKGCFPVGMEEFPAIDQNQFEYIKKEMDDSDYYILMLGGSVGTICEETQNSYTYMEYRYAIEKNIPVVVFVKKDEKGNLFCIEKDKKRKNYYLKFVAEVTETRMCTFFRKKSELSGMVHFSMSKMIEEYPRQGWKKVEFVELNNNQELIFRGRLLNSFCIGKEIYDYTDEYSVIQSFGQTKSPLTLKYGVDTQGGFKLILFVGEDVARNLFYDVGNEYFDENGMLLDKVKMQISLARMGNYEEVLLFFSVGDKSISMMTKVFRINDSGMNEIANIQGQEFMYVDYNLIAPYGSQGGFENYVYCKGSMYHAVRF